MSKNLTLIIITYKRYDYLKRLLFFYKSFNVDFKILVLDSSPEDPEDNDLTKILCSNLVHWIRFDSSIFFVNKIQEACKYITTEFCVLCPDDDYIFPNALEDSVEFLRNNKNYSSCHGLYFQHKYTRILNSIFISLEQIYLKSSGAECENSEQRVSTYLKGESILPFYAVHNSNLFSNIWTETSNIVTDWGLSEIFPCILSLYAGKMKVLNIPYCTREPNSESWYNHERYLQMYSTEKVEKVINSLSGRFVKNPEIKTLLYNYINIDDNNVKLEKRNKSIKALLFNLDTKKKFNNFYIKIKIILNALIYNYKMYIGHLNGEYLKKSLLLIKTKDAKLSRVDYSSQGV
jgi:glycosyltransferase domain-containing protein